MLGIKKQNQPSDDLDDLLGDVGTRKRGPAKKKNDDFFNDLEL